MLVRVDQIPDRTRTGRGLGVDRSWTTRGPVADCAWTGVGSSRTQKCCTPIYYKKSFEVTSRIYKIRIWCPKWGNDRFHRFGKCRFLTFIWTDFNSHVSRWKLIWQIQPYTCLIEKMSRDCIKQTLIVIRWPDLYFLEVSIGSPN